MDLACDKSYRVLGEEEYLETLLVEYFMRQCDSLFQACLQLVRVSTVFILLGRGLMV